jgi:hypothetical protein
MDTINELQSIDIYPLIKKTMQCLVELYGIHIDKIMMDDKHEFGKRHDLPHYKIIIDHPMESIRIGMTDGMYFRIYESSYSHGCLVIRRKNHIENDYIGVYLEESMSLMKIICWEQNKFRHMLVTKYLLIKNNILIKDIVTVVMSKLYLLGYY